MRFFTFLLFLKAIKEITKLATDNTKPTSDDKSLISVISISFEVFLVAK